MKLTNEQLLLAADWLDCYDGEADGNDDLSAVAVYLRSMAERREISSLAKKHGLPVKEVRKALKKLSTQ